MKSTFYREALLESILVLSGAALCHAQAGHGRNNPYSPSPGGRDQVARPITIASVATPRPDPNQGVFIQAGGGIDTDYRPTPTRTYSKRADTVPPTEVYKIGVGDVLYVNLLNAVRGSGYYTVRENGTIDFPLAGEDLIVAGQPVDAIEELLTSHITLYPNPRTEVKVREYASHKITVSGLVDSAGERSLQREAIPLYVVKAMAVVSPRATKVRIMRAARSEPETYDLSDAKTDNILIYPGNSIEFASAGNMNLGVFFISGDIASPGQKDLIPGMTLYQAIAASGGGKGTPKKAIVRRKADNGLFTTYPFDLRAIKDGKAADPALQTGDVIEIKN